jgi:hypothetical protein
MTLLRDVMCMRLQTNFGRVNWSLFFLLFIEFQKYHFLLTIYSCILSSKVFLSVIENKLTLKYCWFNDLEESIYHRLINHI